MKERALSQFESFAQKLVEGGMQRLLGASGKALTRQIISGIARTMEDSAVLGLATPRYRIFLNPADHQQLGAKLPDLAVQLERALAPLARQAGLRLGGEPEVLLAPDQHLASGATRVEVLDVEAGETTGIHRWQAPSTSADVRSQLEALDAFLIVNGRRHIPLDKPLVTIGRSMKMDVIVDASAVSREHAHLRWRYGRFVLYDAGSRAGVTVNGEQCHECVLRPGDLIMLAGQVSLIYGEGLEDRRRLPQPGSTLDEATQTFPRQDVA